MRALVYEGPETLKVRSWEDPETPAGHHLVKIDTVGICGSDMHGYLGHDARRPAPLILGHEAAGVVHGGPRDGERVTINPLVPCGVCRYCRSGRENICPERQLISMPPRQGAFAEWVAMPDANLVQVPDDVSLADAALVEPIACGWHAGRLGNAVLGGAPETALVIGGGAIGIGAALSLTAQGVGHVVMAEPNALRRKYLTEVCEQDARDPSELTGEGEYDLVVDAVGYAATRADASRHAAPGGVITHIGLGEASGGLDSRRFTLQEITFIGTYTYTAQDFRDTAQALFEGRLGKINWTEQRGLSDGAQAFADIRAGKVAAPKVLLDPTA